MARPRKDKELRVHVTARLGAQALREIDDIVTTFYGSRTQVLEEMILMGLEEYKKKNADMMRLIEQRRKEAGNVQKKRLG